jgi:hypothetical protein
MAPKLDPNAAPVLMAFDGMLIGSAALANNYQIGVVPTPDHQFSILVSEFQKETVDMGSTTREFYSRIRSQEFTFSDLPPRSYPWVFEVEQRSPFPDTATGYEPGRKPQRINGDPTPEEELDHRWAPVLSDTDDFRDHGPLTKQPGVLNPIINFKHGLFYTRERLTEMDVFRKVDGEARQLLGVICKRFAANIEGIRAGEGQLVLRTQAGGSEEIFRLTVKPNRKFSILFQNTPSHAHATSSGVQTHFPIIYSVFRPGNKRYDLVLEPDKFPGDAFNYPQGPMVQMGGPPPFRCGPVLINQVLE